MVSGFGFLLIDGAWFLYPYRINPDPFLFDAIWILIPLIMPSGSGSIYIYKKDSDMDNILPFRTWLLSVSLCLCYSLSLYLFVSAYLSIFIPVSVHIVISACLYDSPLPQSRYRWWPRGSERWNPRWPPGSARNSCRLTFPRIKINIKSVTVSCTW